MEATIFFPVKILLQNLKTCQLWLLYTYILLYTLKKNIYVCTIYMFPFFLLNFAETWLKHKMRLINVVHFQSSTGMICLWIRLRQMLLSFLSSITRSSNLRFVWLSALSYNLYTVKFTHFKCTIICRIVYHHHSGRVKLLPQSNFHHPQVIPCTHLFSFYLNMTFLQD